jgi:hypothetical protein
VRSEGRCPVRRRQTPARFSAAVPSLRRSRSAAPDAGRTSRHRTAGQPRRCGQPGRPGDGAGHRPRRSCARRSCRASPSALGAPSCCDGSLRRTRYPAGGGLSPPGRARREAYGCRLRAGSSLVWPVRRSRGSCGYPRQRCAAGGQRWRAGATVTVQAIVLRALASRSADRWTSSTARSEGAARTAASVRWRRQALACSFRTTKRRVSDGCNRTGPSDWGVHQVF